MLTVSRLATSPVLDRFAAIGDCHSRICPPQRKPADQFRAGARCEALGDVGSPGTNSPDLSGERRQVSVLFAYMAGFAAIAERLNEDDTFAFVRMTYDKLAGAVRQHGGSVRGFAGDSIMGVFGIPDAQEDAALRVVCSLETGAF